MLPRAPAPLRILTGFAAAALVLLLLAGTLEHPAKAIAIVAGTLAAGSLWRSRRRVERLDP